MEKIKYGLQSSYNLLLGCYKWLIGLHNFFLIFNDPTLKFKFNIREAIALTNKYMKIRAMKFCLEYKCHKQKNSH